MLSTHANVGSAFLWYLQKLLEQDKRNHEAYIKSGEIFEDRQQAYERMIKAVERLTTGVQSLADLLGLPMPILPTSATLSKGGLQIIESTSSFTVREDEQGVGIWDDEEERRFYEELLDLKELVPSGLLGIKEKKIDAAAAGVAGKADAEAADASSEGVEVLERQQREEEDLKRQLEALALHVDKAEVEKPGLTSQPAPFEQNGSNEAPDSPGISSTTLPDVGDLEMPVDNGIVGEEEGLQSGPAARLTALLAALPEAVNREMVDKLAVEFAFLNSKAARKRMVKVSFVAE